MKTRTSNNEHFRKEYFELLQQFLTKEYYKGYNIETISENHDLACKLVYDIVIEALTYDQYVTEY